MYEFISSSDDINCLDNMRSLDSVRDNYPDRKVTFHFRIQDKMNLGFVSSSDGRNFVSTLKYLTRNT